MVDPPGPLDSGAPDGRSDAGIVAPARDASAVPPDAGPADSSSPPAPDDPDADLDAADPMDVREVDSGSARPAMDAASRPDAADAGAIVDAAPDAGGQAACLGNDIPAGCAVDPFTTNGAECLIDEPDGAFLNAIVLDCAIGTLGLVLPASCNHPVPVNDYDPNPGKDFLVCCAFCQ